MRRVLLRWMFALAVTHSALAQGSSYCAAHSSTLYCQLPSLYGNSEVNPLLPINEALGTQLTLVPLASPASGIVFTMDPSLKIPVASGTETLGPVLTERGETLYRRKLFVASTYQRFRFNSLDGVNFKSIPMVFEFCTSAGQCGPIAVVSRVDAHLEQFALFGTYGITNWLDVSAAIPFAKVTLDAEGIGCTEPYCSFTTAGGATVAFQQASKSGSDTGLGDIVLRAKANPFKFEKFRLAIGSDFRLPTGDTLNFLGAGSPGVKPFVAVSRSGRFSPHVNLSYQWNGSSLLGGSTLGEKGAMPKNISYIGGIDAGLSKSFTLSADYLGEHVMDESRLAKVATLGVADTAQAQGSFDAIRGAIGFKWLAWRQFLITGNVLQKFDHNGLHHTTVPLVGVSYTF